MLKEKICCSIARRHLGSHQTTLAFATVGAERQSRRGIVLSAAIFGVGTTTHASGKGTNVIGFFAVTRVFFFAVLRAVSGTGHAVVTGPVGQSTLFQSNFAPRSSETGTTDALLDHLTGLHFQRVNRVIARYVSAVPTVLAVEFTGRIKIRALYSLFQEIVQHAVRNDAGSQKQQGDPNDYTHRSVDHWCSVSLHKKIRRENYNRNTIPGSESRKDAKESLTRSFALLDFQKVSVWREILKRKVFGIRCGLTLRERDSQLTLFWARSP
jgi:hypothetical protein